MCRGHGRGVKNLVVRSNSEFMSSRLVTYLHEGKLADLHEMAEVVEMFLTADNRHFQATDQALLEVPKQPLRTGEVVLPVEQESSSDNTVVQCFVCKGMDTNSLNVV